MRLYCISLEEAAKVEDAYCIRCFPRRFAQAAKFVQREDRLRSIGAGLLLHGILGIDEQEIRFAPHGKPYLINSQTHFNLSHSGSYAVLAVHHRPVGIDIEKIDEANLEIAPSVYTAEELEWMSEAPSARFTVLWTMKESVLKAVGSGLSIAPLSFSVMPMIRNGKAELFDRIRYCKAASLQSCVLSICTEEPMGEIECVRCKANDLIHTDREW